MTIAVLPLSSIDSSTPKNTTFYWMAVNDEPKPNSPGIVQSSFIKTDAYTPVNGGLMKDFSRDRGSTLPLSSIDSSTPKNTTFYWMTISDQPDISGGLDILSDIRKNAKCNYPPQIGGATIE